MFSAIIIYLPAITFHCDGETPASVYVSKGEEEVGVVEVEERTGEEGGEGTPCWQENGIIPRFTVRSSVGQGAGRCREY